MVNKVNLYTIDGKKIKINELSHDSLMTEVNTLLGRGLGRLTNLENLHNEFALPTLHLYGNIDKMTKDKAVNLRAVYSDGVRTFECIANTKWQGGATLNLPKKNFNIKLRDNAKNKYIVSFKDWFPTHKYHIKANYSTPSLVRNSVGSRLGRMAYPNLYPNDARGVIDSFPFILYINDEWWGCYTWNLAQDGNLFAMDKDNKNHMVFRCNANSTNPGWTMETFEDRLRDDSTTYSLECLRRMVDWTNNCTVEEFKNNVEDYFDLESLLYYWPVVEIYCGTDSMNNNTTWASWDGEHWYVLWYDTDLIFGLSSALGFSPTLDLIAVTKTEQYAYKYNPIWDKLYQAFYDELCEKYAELRTNIFTDAETIIGYFMDYRNMWGEENLALEVEKWPPRNPDNAIERCGDKITQRLAYCDNKYGYTAS